MTQSYFILHRISERSYKVFCKATDNKLISFRFETYEDIFGKCLPQNWTKNRATTNRMKVAFCVHRFLGKEVNNWISSRQVCCCAVGKST